MNGAWWVGEDELDDDQLAIIKGDQDASILTLGPPGSGKTNLLLLRANFLYLAGHKNILIIVFTRTLRDFIADGSSTYAFPSERIVTSTRWGMDFLSELGHSTTDEKDFESKRMQLMLDIAGHIKKNNMQNYYDAILLDEAQDYKLNEIEIFRSLTPRLIMAADVKQKIWDVDSSITDLKTFVDQTDTLTLHYRNGVKICQVADSIAEHFEDYSSMYDSCNYDEASRPSSVEVIKCDSIEEQISEIISKLDIQLKAYPDELIGIVTPNNAELDMIWKRIQESEFSEVSILHGHGFHISFKDDTRICVTNSHSAKGLEFRVLNFISAEKVLTHRQRQKKIAFTTITRCKTSMIVTHTSNLPGYLDKALRIVEPIPPTPSMTDVFGGAS